MMPVSTKCCLFLGNTISQHSEESCQEGASDVITKSSLLRILLFFVIVFLVSGCTVVVMVRILQVDSHLTLEACRLVECCCSFILEKRLVCKSFVVCRRKQNGWKHLFWKYVERKIEKGQKDFPSKVSRVSN